MLASRWVGRGAAAGGRGQRRGFAQQGGQRAAPPRADRRRARVAASDQKQTIARLAQLPVGHRTAGLKAATAAGESNPGVALAFLCLTFGGRAPREPRPAPQQGSGGAGAVFDADREWICPRCGAQVLHHKTECYKCRMPKLPEAEHEWSACGSEEW
eukprot:SAG22_NODE_8300_length_666_cov_1.098765_1_plen_156_part_01